MTSLKNALRALVVLGTATTPVTAFWRLGCGIIQMGRVDPIINPGVASGHAHIISGPNNFNTTSDYDSLQASVCTSCTVQADKSAYWTPLLYYKMANGSFTKVSDGGVIVYYLGRGVGNATAFPPGFRMLSGNVGFRSYDNKTLTYGNASYPSRPIADRTSFNCINYDAKPPNPETPGFPAVMDCPQGLRAQIQFQSCWDGVNLYFSNQSHVAYLSQIDNGVCPPTHPVLLPHLFLEIYYNIADVDTSDNGTFLFSSGDETGYGFHGDFLNGWDVDVQERAVKECLADVGGGTVEECAAFSASFDPLAKSNCPQQPPIVDEQVAGVLSALPGCNPPTGGPDFVPQILCPGTLIPQNTTTDYEKRVHPTVNVSTITLSSSEVATFKGCFVDNTNNQHELPGPFYRNEMNMTNKACGEFCQTQGSSVFGTQYAYECYCGSTVPSTATKGTECDRVCTGNLADYCGGSNRLSVWEV